MGWQRHWLRQIHLLNLLSVCIYIFYLNISQLDHEQMCCGFVKQTKRQKYGLRETGGSQQTGFTVIIIIWPEDGAKSAQEKAIPVHGWKVGTFSASTRQPFDFINDETKAIIL